MEFKDKKVARSVAEMLNAQTIGGKKGTRWRDDIWTMKYLPKFKWNMLTEQVGMCFVPALIVRHGLIFALAHEAALHTAKLRVELSQSRAEQQDYLKNVELARVLNKRAEKKREKGEELQLKERPRKRAAEDSTEQRKKTKIGGKSDDMNKVLGSIF